MNERAPIGVFDSGVGGLSVLRHVRALLPDEALVYVADSGHAPYGPRPAAWVEARSLALAGFLLAQGAKALVVACNTATAAAAATLRARLAVPVVGVEPGLKPGVARSAGRVAVLATEGTLSSAKFRDLRGRFARGVEVIVEPCPGWVELVERGALAGPEARAAVARRVEPLVRAGVDTLVLGCTHYPFLAPVIAEVAGPGVALVDTGEAVARQLGRRLAEGGLLAPAPPPGAPPAGEAFWTSGAPAEASATMGRLWGRPVEVRELPAGVR